MSTAITVQEQNRELARRINEEALKNPASPYANQLIGIANGQVAVVSDDWSDLAKRLRQIEPDPARTFSFAASENNDEVEYIWGLT